jgi:hypothetical protein
VTNEYSGLSASTRVLKLIYMKEFIKHGILEMEGIEEILH